MKRMCRGRRLVRRRGVLAAAFAAVIAVSVGVSAAGATVAFHVRYDDDPHEFGFSDCGTDWAVSETGSGNVLARVDGTGQAFLVKSTFDHRSVVTNTETDQWFVVEGHGAFNELRATPVPGTESEYEFVVIEAGQAYTVKDAAGNVVHRDRGVTRITYRFDTLGDGEPGGIYLGDVDVTFHGPHPGASASFCGYALELTT